MISGRRPDNQHRKDKLIRLYGITGAAAAIALLVLAGCILFKGPRHGQTSPDLVSRPGSLDHIQLELASGKAVNLSRQEGLIRTEGIELINKKDVLTYQSSTSANGLNTLTIPAGNMYSITLADSTQIWLNSVTTLRFPFKFSGNRREISINGEAYLKVAKKPDMPFIVHLPNSDVQVTGTEFNVNNYNADAEQIALIEGSVNLTAGNTTTALSSGKQAVYSEHTGWSINPFDGDQVTGWRQGLFYFYDATLKDITLLLTRWYGITVIIDHAGIRDRRLAGVLDKKQPLEVFLENIKAVARIHYYYTEKGQELHFADASLQTH